MRRSAMVAALGLFASCLLLSAPAFAQSAALSGQVTSDKEGAMEGVVVSAKKVGSTVTVSVPTDDKGQFSFPASRLEPGQYGLSIRAVGYDLEGPRSADVAAGKTESIEIKLAPTKNLPKQMSNAEWFLSFPGTDRRRRRCSTASSCHNLDRIVSSQYDGEQFVDIFNRMVGYYPGSTPEHPQRLVGNAQRSLGQGPNLRMVAEYLASVNLSKETLVLSAEDAAAPDRPRQPRHRHRICPAAPADPAARRRARRAGHDLVHAFRRAVPRQDGSEDRQGLGISDPGAEAGLSGRHARSRARQGRQSLGRDDVSGRHRAVRQEDRDVHRPGRFRRNGRPTRPRPAISIRHSRMSTARSG